jgi:hypothetical protein
MSLIQLLLDSPHKAIKEGILMALIDNNAPHDDAWEADRRWLCAACTKAALPYDALATALQVAGHRRPSHGGHAYRQLLVELLAVEGATIESVVAGADGDLAYLEGLVRS